MNDLHILICHFIDKKGLFLTIFYLDGKILANSNINHIIKQNITNTSPNSRKYISSNFVQISVKPLSKYF